ncbi:RNA 2',3'-cyclic phosphodiesterase [Lentibacillus salicampi]|uniref:RNA 2',3'-cyclic phosphodiesterase n=1 Tax=Lentibacillus salicampi TaxID=175306 RepID=A0A4Y9AB05_9BACI|nr:RNA 2',3'-cyclic phosphodiesterase [Lentibacillus salicampi]TFJ92595.1 RNA 2',3'-cyclic phosphodiesterase [Lentibacillus salicampi]
MNLPHYFIALPLPDFLKEQYASWQRALKDKLPYKQWTHPEDLHITLKFLGAVEEKQFQTLKQSIKTIENVHAFPLTAEPLGTFGHPEKPRVLWAGVERKHELIRLQKTIEEIAVKVGLQQEKRAYLPHITLAKKWTGGAQDLSGLKQNYTGRQTFKVKQVVIYRIHPGKSPTYQVVAAYDLTRGGDVNGTAN